MNKSNYDEYVLQCHAQNAGDIALRETEILDVPSTYPLWTSKGTAGNFMWRALTTLFPPDIHFLDKEKTALNKFFSTLASQSGLQMMAYLANSMTKDPDYKHLVTDGFTLIANSEVLLFDQHEWEQRRASGMREYLRQNITLNDNECFYIEDGDALNFYFDKIKDQNIVIPMPVLMNSRLELYVKIADLLCKHGAKAVYGVFLTYVVPGSNGADYPHYPAIPEIRGMSFEDLLNM